MKKITIMLLVSLALFSCATKISSLKNNPEQFAGQIVKVKGEVTKLVNIPFTDYSFFELTDNSDNIIVFSMVEHQKGNIITFNAKVVGYDSSNQENSTLMVIDAVEEFILNSVKLDEAKVKKSAKAIGTTLSKALDASSATYLLLEQDS